MTTEILAAGIFLALVIIFLCSALVRLYIKEIAKPRNESEIESRKADAITKQRLSQMNELVGRTLVGMAKITEDTSNQVSILIIDAQQARQHAKTVREFSRAIANMAAIMAKQLKPDEAAELMVEVGKIRGIMSDDSGIFKVLEAASPIPPVPPAP